MTEKVELPDHYLFVAEITGVHCEEAALAQGEVKVENLKPFVLTMPGNLYQALGEPVGEAWKIGQVLLGK